MKLIIRRFDENMSNKSSKQAMTQAYDFFKKTYASKEINSEFIKSSND